MSFKLKTISQLDPLTSVTSDPLFGVSSPIEGTSGEDTQYASKSIAYSVLSDAIASEVELKIATDFNLIDVTSHQTNINVADIAKTVHKLSAEDCKIDGLKTFTTPPFVNDTVEYGKTVDVAENMIPTVGYVKS